MKEEIARLIEFEEEVKRYYDEVKKIATRLGMSD